MAVGPDSAVHAVFPASSFHEEKSFDEVVRPLMYARSTDGGESWSEAEDVYAAYAIHGDDAEGGPAGAAAAPAPDNSLLWAVLGAAVALGLGGLVLLAGTRLARSPRGEEQPAPSREAPSRRGRL